ncbi:lipase [Streptomyces sp. CB02923]|uniref:esterase/lipase family protein n=1 Tax=Streptomyces sp. CB02923 TaxID=1718985 RepID=UPI00093A9DE2|nr:alpha/beta fold hydrolase [Streptomyces sp. CB02923]OKI02090.1 lipase [Streptomyces sp. CB02923]
MRSNGTMRARRRRRPVTALTGLAVAAGLVLAGAAAAPATARTASTTASATAVSTAQAPAAQAASVQTASVQAPPVRAGAVRATSAGAASGASTATDPVGPPQGNFLSAFLYSVTQPTALPPGANDWSCKPGPAHPRPIVLAHGTFENRYANWAALSPELKNAGYCVFALNYGGTKGPVLGTGDIAASAGQLAAFVDRVRAATGAAKVDIVGHSQGGMMPRYYIKNLGGAAKVGRLVALVPSNHGTSLIGLGLLARLVPGADVVVGAACPSCEQQIVGSRFLKELNAGGETDPAVDYTVISTWYDEVVTPYTSAFLPSARNVTNETLQSHCLLNITAHINITYDRTATRLVLNALDPAHAQRPTC